MTLRFMKRVALFLLFTPACLTFCQQPTDPADDVSPNIGGIGQLLTATEPYVQCPHGMVRIAPVTTPGITDRYLADEIYGFPAGPATLMASVGGVSTNPADYASAFDHDFEISKPYYYEADLQTWGIRAEVTATCRAAYYRFTSSRSKGAHLSLSLDGDGSLTVAGENAVMGSERYTGPISKDSDPKHATRQYFYIQFSQPFASYVSWHGDTLGHQSAQSGEHIGFAGEFSSTANPVIEARVGISFISAEQARQNLQREIPDWNFETVKAEMREVWNNALSAIEIQGGTQRQRTIFYTALYRSLERMTDITEDGRYYSGFDHAVHDAKGRDFYVDDGLWDTYRSLHPLQLLLNAQQQEDMIESYLRMYEQSGWLPSFPSAAGEQAVMIGHHAAQFILDTYEKGYRDFDVDEAYAAMRKNATEATMLPWSRGPLTGIDRIYFSKGFFPALDPQNEAKPQPTPERRQAVSVTLENSYDDWCVAQLAKALGKEKDFEYFMHLAQNYKNVYNPAIGFMAPKDRDGKWIEPFDPKLGGGQGGRDYFTEVNSWLYTFNVQFDVSGLIRLMGGRNAFNAKLDQLFVEQYGEAKYEFLGQFPDATGLIGQYAQGNEPSFHIPYLYDFSGEPWKTQRRVRQIMDVWYGDGPRGLAGDDDGGALSSWYVLSAMGFYPVCPGSPVYEIGSPIFEKSVMRLGNGKQFVIIAHNVSARNKYIQSAQLNGQPLKMPWFSQSDIAGGAVLILEMGDRPNRQWGSAPEDAPPATNVDAALVRGARPR